MRSGDRFSVCGGQKTAQNGVFEVFLSIFEVFLGVFWRF
jgi:hypothetical protein